MPVRFEACEPPAPHELAISNPADDLPKFMEPYGIQYRYWHRKVAQTEANVEIGEFLYARIVLDELAAADVSFSEFVAGESELSRQEVRHHFLSAVANATFLRQLLQYANSGVSDAVANRAEPTFALDFQYDEEQRPLDRRIHLRTSDVDEIFGTTSENPQWYQARNLYVRRAAPAQPTDRLLVSMQQRGIWADFQNMTTLEPYLVSQHSR
ncbi:MAG TPA: hypothetical protein VJR27_03885 [Candidatus Saccharimonadales bacterium]|nr:hypothetical protein [Candidatus Saccharimonadales bacterium]